MPHFKAWHSSTHIWSTDLDIFWPTSSHRVLLRQLITGGVRSEISPDVVMPPPPQEPSCLCQVQTSCPDSFKSPSACFVFFTSYRRSLLYFAGVLTYHTRRQGDSSLSLRHERWCSRKLSCEKIYKYEWCPLIPISTFKTKCFSAIQTTFKTQDNKTNRARKPKKCVCKF